MDELIAWLALREIEGVGDTIFRRLVEHFKTPENALKANIGDLMEVEGVHQKIASSIVETASSAVKRAEEIWEKSRAAEAEIITFDEAPYPRPLLETSSFPVILYMKGNSEIILEEKNIAIVGTRRATQYGKNITRAIAGALAERGVVITSGLATGIDSTAHSAALSVGGKTIAVLGCGIDIVYPPENKKLLREIFETSLAVTEFPPGTIPSPENFPRRNRIIAGLAQGVAVIEAGEKSGALITANWANEFNRPVYAVPGAVTSPQSVGANNLIKTHKAALIESWEDIADDLPTLGVSTKLPLSAKDRKPEFEAEEEKIIYDLLHPSEPVHIDSLALKTGYSIGTLLTHLLALEIRDIVEQLPGKLFVRKF